METITEAPSPASTDRGIETNINVFPRTKNFECSEGLVIKGFPIGSGVVVLPEATNYSPRNVSGLVPQLKPEIDNGSISPWETRQPRTSVLRPRNMHAEHSCFDF